MEYNYNLLAVLDDCESSSITFTTTLPHVSRLPKAFNARGTLFVFEPPFSDAPLVVSVGWPPSVSLSLSKIIVDVWVRLAK